MLETLQRGIQRAVIDDQRIGGAFLNGTRNPLPVLSAEEEDAEDEEIERSLKQGIAIGSGCFGRHSTQRYGFLGRMSTGVIVHD